MNNTPFLDEQNPYIKSLIDSHTPHTITYTGNSIRVDVAGRKLFFSDMELSPRELAFVGMAKRDVLKYAAELRIPERSPRFSKIFPWRVGEHVGGLVEVDISSAFWDCAFRHGLLTIRTFEAGEKVRKEVRLIALGAAAAVHRSFEFDGEAYTDPKETVDVWGRRAYFYVASKITALMDQICQAAPGACALYWVDAIVCRPEYAAFVQRSVSECGYTSKAHALTGCHFSVNREGEKKWTVYDTKKEREKTFRDRPRKKTEGLAEMINLHLER